MQTESLSPQFRLPIANGTWRAAQEANGRADEWFEVSDHHARKYFRGHVAISRSAYDACMQGPRSECAASDDQEIERRCNELLCMVSLWARVTMTAGRTDGECQYAPVRQPQERSVSRLQFEVPLRVYRRWTGKGETVWMITLANVDREPRDWHVQFEDRTPS